MTMVTIGQPLTRKDGFAKVTGAARYTTDLNEVGQAYARLVTSKIAAGRLVGLDVRAAAASPGVHLVLTHENADPVQPLTFVFTGGQGQSSHQPMTSDEIRYAGQTIAVVVAETQEAADEAGRLITAEYEARTPAASIEDAGAGEAKPAGEPIEIGDADAALAAAAVKVDAEYVTPAQHHNPMELYATTASWRAGKLTVWLPSQWVVGTQVALATAFEIAMEDVQVICPYVGGGFGSKATVMPHTILTAMAARRLGRPVKLVVDREQMYTAGSFRPAAIQRVALGADRDGKLQALVHEQRGQTSRFDDASFAGTDMTARMYACPNIRTAELIIATDVNTPGFMRAPNEVPTFFGFESAVDELALALGIDPIELRKRNEPERDPVKGLPWSSRSLVPCYERAAELFGWQRRDPRPGSMRDGDELVGWGCATATYPTQLGPASVRLRLAGNGSASIASAAHDIGTGTYTIMAQVVADRLGLPMDRVGVELGDSSLPYGPMAGGSETAGSLSAAIVTACEEAGARLIEAASKAEDGPLAGSATGQLRLEGGDIVGSDGKRETWTAVLNRTPTGVIEIAADWAPSGMAAGMIRSAHKGAAAIAGPSYPKFTACAFGAELVEVRINRRTGSIRCPRAVGMFAAGTILNRKTAHSQLMGGMVWGISNGLLEASEVDRRYGRFVNANIAEYHVAVNADIVDVTVEMLDEKDELVNPMGVKGLGELGIVGTSAALANAVFHATGVRVRKTPIMIEDVLDAL